MFITFEGGEGSGKTTLIEKINKALISEGYKVVITREPGGSKISEKIRNILLDNDNTEIKAHTEALLFAASRAQHLDEVIIPNLDKIVICDRYLDSSVAYQAYGRELGLDFIYSINKYALKYMPDLTFFIKLEPEIGLKRVSQKRSNKKDRLDQEKVDFHNRVYNGYLALAETDKNRIITIDGNNTIDNLFQIIMSEIKKKL